jgi:hypothetical protein
MRESGQKSRHGGTFLSLRASTLRWPLHEQMLSKKVATEEEGDSS